MRKPESENQNKPNTNLSTSPAPPFGDGGLELILFPNVGDLHGAPPHSSCAPIAYRRHWISPCFLIWPPGLWSTLEPQQLWLNADNLTLPLPEAKTLPLHPNRCFTQPATHPPHHHLQLSLLPRCLPWALQTWTTLALAGSPSGCAGQPSPTSLPSPWQPSFEAPVIILFISASALLQSLCKALELLPWIRQHSAPKEQTSEEPANQLVQRLLWQRGGPWPSLLSPLTFVMAFNSLLYPGQAVFTRSYQFGSLDC